jgi:RNHCP domain
MRYVLDINSDFKCIYCRNAISAEVLLAGVNNRNHCPYCLWSRHMDLFQAGDRLSACKAPMRPVGLTMKRSRKKYATLAVGELMLVHQCSACERISINRIAADDDAQAILDVFNASLKISNQRREEIQGGGITLLGDENSSCVYRQLFGESRPSFGAGILFV